MPSAPFGFGGLLGGGPVPDVQMPDGLPVGGGLGSPLVDAYFALQGKRIKDAVTAPRDAYTGDLQVLGADGHPTDEAMDRASGLAGLAMTGSVPFSLAAGRFGLRDAMETANALASPAETLVSRAPPMYDPVARPARPFEADYPAARWPDGPPVDTSGRLTRDIEGRPLNPDARIVGRGTVGGPDEALAPAELDAIAAAALGQEPQNAPRGSIPGRGVGAYQQSRGVDGPERAIFVDGSLPPAIRDRVLAHEFGHAVDDIAGQPVDGRLRGAIPQAGITRELGQLYNETNNDLFRSALDRRGGDIDAARAEGTNRRNFTPEVAGYAKAQVPDELMAEGVRGYLADPNAMKAAYPKTAARIRAAVNEDPVLSPLIQFNAGGSSGGAAGLPALASSDPKGPPVSAGIVPFGALPQFAGLSPDDLARLARSQQPAAPTQVDGLLFDRAGMGGQGGFSGTSGAIVPPAAPAQPEPEAEAPTARAMPSPPVRPLSFGSLRAPAAPAEPAQTPASPALTTTGSVAPSPATAPEPASGGSIFGRLGDPRVANVLLGISQGLLSTKGFGPGIAAGIGAASRLNKDQAVTDLAQAEYGLKLRKLTQEQGATNATAQAISEKLGVPYERALAFAADKDFVNSFIKGTYGTAATKATAQATAEGAAAGAKDDVQLQQLPDGRLVAINKSNLFPSGDEPAKPAVAQVAASVGVTPLTVPNDRLRAGIRQDDNRAAWQKPDGTVTFEPQPPSTTINMPPAEKAEQGAIGTARAGIIKEHIEGGRAARDKIQILDQMRGALDAAGPNITTGPLGEPVLRAKQALGGMLGTQIPGTSATELFANSGPVLAGAAARAITARPAQIEFTTMLNAKPGLMNSPEGNRASMDVMRQGAVRDADVADLAARSSSADEFLKRRDEYEAAHQMINPFTGKPFGSASAPVAASGSGQSSPVIPRRRVFDPRTGGFN